MPQLERVLEEEIHAAGARRPRPATPRSRGRSRTTHRSPPERGELIALPFLLIVLLLVFRSPIAAAIPLAFGAITVVASRGILYFFTGWFEHRRLRADRLHDDGPGAGGRLRAADGLPLPRGAGRRAPSRSRRRRLTRRTAGRTTVFAGSTLLLSMLVSLFIVPGSLLASLAGTVAMVVVLSVAVATLVGPAMLVLLGPNVDRWRIGPRRRTAARG